MEIGSDRNVLEDYDSNDNNDMNEEAEYPSQLLDNFTPFRFIEPEVIIKEFSIENLQALKNTRFVKDTLSQCPVCEKNFQRNSHLKRHLLVHTKEMPFKCDVCGRSFNQSSTMKSHKKSVHSDHKPFSCSEPNCTKSFSIISNLKIHQKSHILIKELACQYCDRTFKHQSSLKAHAKMHVFQDFPRGFRSN